MVNEDINSSQNVFIARIQTDIAWMKESLERIENNHLIHIDAKIEELEKRLNGRPSWVVSIIITLLVGLVSALAVLLLKR